MAEEEYEEPQIDEVQKLKDQLKVAEASQELEAAREAMHADRTDEAAMAKYKELSQKVADARVEFRTKYPPPVPADGDAIATPAPVDASGGVHQG